MPGAAVMKVVAEDETGEREGVMIPGPEGEASDAVGGEPAG